MKNNPHAKFKTMMYLFFFSFFFINSHPLCHILLLSSSLGPSLGPSTFPFSFYSKAMAVSMDFFYCYFSGPSSFEFLSGLTIHDEDNDLLLLVLSENRNFYQSFRGAEWVVENDQFQPSGCHSSCHLTSYVTLFWFLYFSSVLLFIFLKAWQGTLATSPEMRHCNCS